MAEIDKIMLTDAPVMFPPGQVSFTVVWVFFLIDFEDGIFLFT